MAEQADDYQTQLDAADEMLSQGEIEQAFILLERLVDEYPDSADVALLMGDAEREWGDLDAALESYDRAVELEPDWATAIAARAHCLVELGRMAEAQEDVDRALKLDSRCTEAHYVRAILLEFQHRYRQADEAYRTVANLDPETFWVPLRVSRKTFDAAVRKAIARLPQRFRDRMEGVEVYVQDLPDLSAEGDVSPLVMGVFDGYSITERRESDPWTQFPPRICLYQRNIERVCATHQDLIEEIEITLLHEVGHYFGLEEEDLERIDLS